jgi:hypothetical protein
MKSINNVAPFTSSIVFVYSRATTANIDTTLCVLALRACTYICVGTIVNAHDDDDCTMGNSLCLAVMAAEYSIRTYVCMGIVRFGPCACVFHS